MIEVPLSQVAQMLVSIGEGSQIGLLAQQRLASCRGAPKALAATLSQSSYSKTPSTPIPETSLSGKPKVLKRDAERSSVRACRPGWILESTVSMPVAARFCNGDYFRVALDRGTIAEVTSRTTFLVVR